MHTGHMHICTHLQTIQACLADRVCDAIPDLGAAVCHHAPERAQICPFGGHVHLYVCVCVCMCRRERQKGSEGAQDNAFGGHIHRFTQMQNWASLADTRLLHTDAGAGQSCSDPVCCTKVSHAPCIVQKAHPF